MSDAQKLFQELNHQYFKGQLPEYEIVLREDLRAGCGKCDKKRRQLHLAKVTDNVSDERLPQLLLHEMAHAAVPRKEHGKAWLAEMKRLADMGAPTLEDWEAYQDRKRTITNRDIEAEAFDMGAEWPIPWAEARLDIGPKYGLTDAHGRSVSKRAAKFMQKLRKQFYKGRECGWPSPPE
jgi:hypothetical protein